MFYSNFIFTKIFVFYFTLNTVEIDRKVLGGEGKDQQRTLGRNLQPGWPEAQLRQISMR